MRLDTVFCSGLQHWLRFVRSFTYEIRCRFSWLQHWLRLFRLSHMTSATVLRSFAYEIKCSSFFGAITFDTAFPHSHMTSATVFRSFAYDIEYRVLFAATILAAVVRCSHMTSATVCRFVGRSTMRLDTVFCLGLQHWLRFFRRSHMTSATVFRSFTDNNDYVFFAVLPC